VPCRYGHHVARGPLRGAELAQPDGAKVFLVDADADADAGEIAAATAFLASEEAAYITGVVLPVDGGISI
jgi:NAD(P)-dependent dehydrogenase (short-subunit alcohol dehydrogenase family)